jgi:hypothetical protein
MLYLYHVIKTNTMKKQLLIRLKNVVEGQTQLISGLCYEINRMEMSQLSRLQAYQLRTYVRKHRPKPGDKHYYYSRALSAWYWPEGEVEPRVAWLNDCIENYRWWYFFTI